MDFNERATTRRRSTWKRRLYFLFAITALWLVLRANSPVPKSNFLWIGKILQDDRRIELSSSAPINIAIVSCDRRGNYGSANLASVMIKSVLISAELYHVPSVHFHIFLEHLANQNFFKSVLKEYGYPNENKKVEIKLHFYSALAVIPKKYQYRLIYKPPFPKCGFVRFFVSSHLRNVNEILYLDTDTIVTGSISKLWAQFSKMNAQQLIAVAPNTLLGPDSDNVHNHTFGNFPYVSPRGLNSGVVLMNLTKMRAFNWDKKLLGAYRNYSRRYKESIPDQTLLNIFLYFQPELLYRIPCQYNFMYVYCDGGHAPCHNAEEDSDGIQIVHGAGGQYFKPKSGLYPVHQVYKEINLTSHFPDDLVQSFQRIFGEGLNKNECFKYLNRLFYKSYL